MIHPTRPVLLALFLFLPACTHKTRPAQVFPGFESAPANRLATIRESDNIYINSIGTRNSPELEDTLLGPGAYRQFQIPAGVHLIAIFYHSGEIESRPYNLIARVQAGHTYSFQSKVERPLITFSTKRTWHAQLIDDATGNLASTQPSRPPTTNTTQPAPQLRNKE